jgi:nucleoside-diphosphate-sugar epimerase
MILLIGGMGFIGLNTAMRLLEVGERVVITQHTSHRLPEPLKDAIGTGVFTARLDVTNPYEVFDVVRRHQVDSIINLMAPPARSLSTQADYHLYTAGLQNVLQASYTFGLSGQPMPRSTPQKISHASRPTLAMHRNIRSRRV